MEKIRLSQTGMQVSRLGLGGIPIQSVSEDEAVGMVRRCLDLGVSLIDTADNYSNSEERISKAISGRREELVIATKTNYETPREIKNNLEQSLKLLRIAFIDLYQFHGVSDFDTYARVIDSNGPMVVTREAKRAELIKHIGISSHSMDIAKEAVKSGIFEIIVFKYLLQFPGMVSLSGIEKIEEIEGIVQLCEWPRQLTGAEQGEMQ